MSDGGEYPTFSPDELRGAGRLIAEGARVFGRYRLEQMVGRGGMGVVWRAWDEELDRVVALKFLPEIVAADAEALAELKRETRRSLELTHPNIVRIHDLESDGALAAISMEYVDGGSLSAFKAQTSSGFFEVEEIWGWMKQLCEALAYAHGRVQVVHRDLKPGNLLVTSGGELKVADFGIARSVSDSASRMSIGLAGSAGTLVFMSPQQLDGEAPKVSDDIYAFGATVYDLLTGKPPFHSGDIAGQIRQKIAPSMARRREELGRGPGALIPMEWERVVASCLGKAPSDRPGSMREVGRMLGVDVGGRDRDAAVGPVTGTAKEVLAVPQQGARGGGAGRQRLRWAIAISAGALALGLMLWLGNAGAGGKAERARVEAAAREAEQERLAREAREAGERRIAEERRKAEEETARALETERTRQMALEAQRAANARGGLLVKTEPVGLAVSVDGGESKPSPAAFSDLKVGRHRLTVSVGGATAKEMDADVAEGKVLEVGPVVLEGLKNSVRVETKPAGAWVIDSDGRRLGKTPRTIADLPVGAVSFRLELDGYEPAKAEGLVEATREACLTVELTPARAAATAAGTVSAVGRGTGAGADMARGQQVASLARKTVDLLEIALTRIDGGLAQGADDAGGLRLSFDVRNRDSRATVMVAANGVFDTSPREKMSGAWLDITLGSYRAGLVTSDGIRWSASRDALSGISAVMGFECTTCEHNWNVSLQQNNPGAVADYVMSGRRAEFGEADQPAIRSIGKYWVGSFTPIAPGEQIGMALQFAPSRDETGVRATVQRRSTLDFEMELVIGQAVDGGAQSRMRNVRLHNLQFRGVPLLAD